MNDAVDQLQKLEEKLLKALELFRRGQQEKLALRRDLEKLRAEPWGRAEATGANAQECVALRREREEVRNRIEKLLQRIDALTTPQSSE